MKPVIRIVEPSGPDKDNLILKRASKLESRGFEVLYTPTSGESSLYSDSIENRANSLWLALTEDHSDIIFCSRGGYGASDLCDQISWKKLNNYKKKWLVGFSDISVIHSCIKAFSTWPSIHGPMIGSTNWNFDSSDAKQLLSIVCKKSNTFSIDLKPLQELDPYSQVQGRLFGGCLSVLSNLLGTPYLPKFSEKTILFFEDIGENYGQVIRHLNQWAQSGQLENVSAIIFGQFLDGKGGSFGQKEFFEIKQRLKHTQIFLSDSFGHGKINAPLVIGSKASIEKNKLTMIF